MKDRPILMQVEMVCATRRDEKTQTRRRLKVQPTAVHWMPERESYPMRGRFEVVDGVGWGVVEYTMGEHEAFVCPYGVPGDRLWVRETWGKIMHPSTGSPAHIMGPEGWGACWRADCDDAFALETTRWYPSIHMPRWASRILLEIVAVRIERVQRITLGEICKEGLARSVYDFKPATSGFKAWIELWDRINGDGAWALNPWVWVVEFKRVL